MYFSWIYQPLCNCVRLTKIKGNLHYLLSYFSSAYVLRTNNREDTKSKKCAFTQDSSLSASK